MLHCEKPVLYVSHLLQTKTLSLFEYEHSKVFKFKQEGIQKLFELNDHTHRKKSKLITCKHKCFMQGQLQLLHELNSKFHG